jgi:carboxypeptidase C (cathepsin A)
MFGLFLENGPLRVERTGLKIDDLVLKPAVNSWADSYNVVFVDQPVGTGFSYFGKNVL